MKNENPSQALANHLPSQIHEEIFGSGGTADKVQANQYAAARKIPARTIYILSTNREHERGLAYAFSDINNRMFRVERSDFFSTESGCYDTFGVDRAACLYAGFKTSFHPLLVIDGGTAMTYTGLDAKGKIMGGGISPGIGSRFKSLSDFCCRLPLITYEEYNQAGELPTFATDTRSSMMTSIFQEVGLHCRNIVKQFLQELSTRGSDGESDEIQKEPNLVSEKKPTVYVTGGDSGFLFRCLEESDELTLAHFNIKETKHLACYGIGNLVQAKSVEVGTPTPDDELRLRLLGQRVAKHFAEPDLEGDFIYRGSIALVLPGKDDMEHDLYSVRYDDGDAEQFTLAEVYGTFK
jgi:pantothenate kinase type III